MSSRRSRIRPLRAAALAALTAGAAACQESITAPGVCPEYCPSTQVVVRDSMVVGSVVRDSTFRGYVGAHRAGAMQLVTAGTPEETRAIVRFLPFPEQIVGDSGKSFDVTVIDSFRVTISVLSRTAAAGGLELELHRLPASVDTLTRFSDIAPYFADSTLLATVPVPDTLTSGALTALLAGDAFPTLAADSFRAAVGVLLRGDSAGWVNLGTREVARPMELTRFVRIDSSEQTPERSDSKQAFLDTYVAAPGPVAGPDVLVVGGIPSARALLRFAVPPAIVDSGDVVKATLLLVPVAPARGAPGDTFRLRADPVSADFGAKSPIITTSADTLVQGVTYIVTGSTDTLEVDVTSIVRSWRFAPERPRALTLRIVPEAAALGEVWLGSSRSAGARPAIRITYAPLFPGDA